MQTGGWFKLDDSWYYIQSNGARRFSELSEIGGKSISLRQMARC